MILSWVLIAAIVVLVVRALSPGSPQSPHGQRGAREILDERYARGEIPEDEYRERTRLLEETAH